MSNIAALFVAWALVAAVSGGVIFGVLSLVGGLGGCLIAGGVLGALSYLFTVNVQVTRTRTRSIL